MTDTVLSKRVEVLEIAVNGPSGLTAQVAELRGDVTGLRSEFLQFRSETRMEFSAVRSEMAAGFKAVRQEMADGFEAVRQEMTTKIDEQGVQMRVLHEEVMARIALLAEGRTRVARPASSRRKR